MPKCVNIRRKHRKVCIGDLDTIIDIQSRDLRRTNVRSGPTQTREVFTTILPDAWALVETKRGSFVVDGVSGDIEFTHMIIIPVPDSPTLTAENWVLLEGNRLRILDIEDYDERGEFLALRCTNRGSDTKAASDA